jgi:hypothetical protein
LLYGIKNKKSDKGAFGIFLQVHPFENNEVNPFSKQEEIQTVLKPTKFNILVVYSFMVITNKKYNIFLR